MVKKSDQKYQITIRNWDKYQRQMRGGEKRKRRREWIAISVDLFSDPDYLSLDATHSRLWLGLLLHSGKVGPVFKLSPSYARHLFDLRRSCDFEVLKNHGFIELEAATLQDTPNDKTRKHDNLPTVSKARPKSPIAKLKHDLRFDDFWEAWPKKEDKQSAKKKWVVMKLDPIADTIIENVIFRTENDVRWRGRQYIPYPATFLNGRRWEDEMIQTKEAPPESKRPDFMAMAKEMEEDERKRLTND